MLPYLLCIASATQLVHNADRTSRLCRASRRMVWRLLRQRRADPTRRSYSLLPSVAAAASLAHSDAAQWAPPQYS